MGVAATLMSLCLTGCTVAVGVSLAENTASTPASGASLSPEPMGSSSAVPPPLTPGVVPVPTVDPVVEAAAAKAAKAQRIAKAKRRAAARDAIKAAEAVKMAEAAKVERIARKQKAHRAVLERGITVANGEVSWRVNSSYRGTFADPDITYSQGVWYSFGTNTSNLRLPGLVSTNLINWTPIRDGNDDKYDPLASVGDWVTQKGGGQGLWAPAVAAMGGGWTVAYSAQQSTMQGERHNCIGLARSPRPGGPYHHLGAPLECGVASRMGVIDPDLYVDPQGRNWMLWKFSGINNHSPATIYIRRLNPSGTGWANGSSATPLITNDRSGWEGNTIENPAMVKDGKKYLLFYSANSYRSADYATGYAICKTPIGPCRKPSSQPLLSTLSTGHQGPGGATAFVSDGALRLMYHAWAPGRVDDLRRMHIATLTRSGRAVTLTHPG